MKPIATITWFDDWWNERTIECYEPYFMEQNITQLKKDERVFFVSMQSLYVPLPVRRARKYRRAI